MKNTNKKLIIIIAAVIVLTAGAGAVAYVTQPKMQLNAQSVQPQNRKGVSVRPNTQVAAVAQPASPRCDDRNILGTIAGGAAGGVIGNQIGNGNGKTAATIGGVIGGAYLGNQYIPTKNATCRQ
jgi:uncharacterized protein YcfJ